MGGRDYNKGFGNEWWCKPANNDQKLDTNYLVNNFCSNFRCTNPKNINNTALVDTAASLLLPGAKATSINSDIQGGNKTVIEPSGGKIYTTKQLELNINSFPPVAKKYIVYHK